MQDYLGFSLENRKIMGLAFSFSSFPISSNSDDDVESLRVFQSYKIICPQPQLE